MVFISTGILLFNDKNYGTNSYLLTDHDGNLVVIDPTLATVNEILKPLENEDDDERVKAVILTSQYLLDYDGISLLINKYPNLDIYINSKDYQGLVDEFKNNNIPIENIKELPDRIEIDGLILNVIKTPGITPGSVCVRYKKFLLTGDTLLTESMYDITIPDVDVVALKNSINNLINSLEPDYFICPKVGNVTRLKFLLKQNKALEKFIKGE